MKPTAIITAITPWLIGVLLSTTAMFLSWDLGRETATLLGGEPALWARTGKGFVIGLVIAGLQWPVVRVVGVPPAGFLVASAIGFAAGYPLGQTAQAIAVLNWGLDWEWGFGAALAVFGLSLALPQWWMLRRHVRWASPWILLSVIAWMLTGAAWIAFGACSGEDAVVYGLVAGLGLVWLVRSQSLRVKAGEPPSTSSRGPVRHDVTVVG